MTFDRNNHHRKSIRLKNYDYTQAGLYFITVCTQNRVALFGTIIDGAMVMNAAGIMVADQWQALGNRFLSIKLYEYIVMPNHFHGIIEIVGAIPCGCPETPGTTPRAVARHAPTVGDIVGTFKSLSTNEYISHVKLHNWPPFSGKLWQRNYYEHIIRNEAAYLKIADYIRTNPQQWLEDIYHA